MKKVLLLITAIAAINMAYAKKVKFRVDMTGQTVSGNGVHIAGDFQKAAGAANNWLPAATSLTKEGSTNIYSIIVDIPAKVYYEFKFINGNDWPQAEGVPAICQKGNTAINGGSNDNRWYFIDSVANDTTVLPAIKFGASAPTGMYAVRISVDMQKVATVSANGVHIAGEVQNPVWNPASNNMVNLFNNNKVYEHIAYLAAGTYAYKFINGDAWGGDESVPGACAVSNNRQVVVGTADITTTKVCFGSCSACITAVVPKYNVTFQVDMQNSNCNGGYDTVSAMGGVLPGGWVSGQQLADPNSDKVFTGTVQLDSGTSVEYKFRSMKNGNQTWESGGNKSFVLMKDTVLPANCFNSNAPCSPQPAPSKVTFVVDLINETPAAQIYMMGDFTTPNWQGGAREMAAVSGSPGLYKVQVDSVCPGTISFKFTNGAATVQANEENFSDTTQRSCVAANGVGGFNRSYIRLSASHVTLSYVYNKCTAGRSTGIADNSLNAGDVNVYPNPTNGLAVVEFNDNKKVHQVSVMDITGKVVRSYSNYQYDALRIERDNLQNGLYFIHIENEAGQQTTVKLIFY